MSDPITFSSIFDPDSTVSVHLGVRDSFVHGQVVMPDSTLSPLSYWGNVFLLDGKIYYNDLVYFGARLGPSWQFDKSVILNDDPAAFTEGSCPDSQRHPVTGECIGDMTTRDTGETLVVRQGAFFAFGAGVDIPVHRVFDLGLAGYVQRDHGEYGNESNPEVLYRATDLTTPRPEYDVLQEYGRWGGDAEISARFRTKFIDARIGGGGSLGWESTASTNEGVEDTQSGLSHRWHFGLGLEFHAARDGIVPKRKPRAVTSSPLPLVSQPEPRAPAVSLPFPEPEATPVVQEPTRLPEPEVMPEHRSAQEKADQLRLQFIRKHGAALSQLGIFDVRIIPHHFSEGIGGEVLPSLGFEDWSYTVQLVFLDENNQEKTGMLTGLDQYSSLEDLAQVLCEGGCDE